MKILLTGANGFVGSHILDRLGAKGFATTLLLRPDSRRSLIEARLAEVEVRLGSLSDPASLRQAMRDVTHVIHCAGSTKALRVEEFYQVNQLGTRTLVEAINQQQGRVQRLVHISSLAAGGPAQPAQPAHEEDPPHPVSEYGKSKLAGECEVQNACKSEFVILRPPAVYGPRDGEFLRLFKAIRAHLLPSFGGGVQALSLVFAKDLAEAVVECLDGPAAVGRTYYVASREIVTVRALAEEIARQIKTWTVPLSLPMAALLPLCYVQEALSQVTRRPSVLSRQKYAELRAPGWVCDSTRLREETGITCATTLRQGIAETLAWYRGQGWL